MKPVKFDECNVVFAKDQPEYIPLPAHRSIEGVVTSCWELSWKERLQVFFYGRIFLRIQTFNKALQPFLLCTMNPIKRSHYPNLKVAAKE